MNYKFVLMLAVLTGIFLLACSPTFNVSAQERPLEINYPELNGDRPTTVNTLIPKYVVYLFNFLVWAVGIFAFIVLIIAGFQYLTSAGNVERISDAKSRIWAALLGMVILFGSYLVLISINPQLIAFNLPTLKPMISALSGGVYLCKEWPQSTDSQDAIKQTASLQLQYQADIIAERLGLYEFPIEEAKEIQEKIDSNLQVINSQCYRIDSQGDIRASFDNKSALIYFIPEIKDLDYVNNNWQSTTTEFGAIIYEEEKFMGKSVPTVRHLLDPQGKVIVYCYNLTSSSFGDCENFNPPSNLKVSSVQPFRLLYEPDENWEVTVYQQPNMDKGFPEVDLIEYINLFKINKDCDAPYWCDYSEFLNPSPRSIEIKGDLLAILRSSKMPNNSPDNRIASFFKSDNDLEDDLNIIDWVDCADYNGVDPHTSGFIFKKCAQASAEDLIIISGAIY